MAELCRSGLDSLVQTKINAFTTATSLDTVLAGALAIWGNKTGTTPTISATVATVNDLPNLYSTLFPVGQLVFVRSIGVVVVSGDTAWYGIDGSKLREDAPQYSLWTWGYNFWGKLGDGTATARSSPGTTIGGGTNWLNATAVGRTMAAVKTDGTLWTWGGQYSATLGDIANTGNSFSRNSPASISTGGSDWSKVATGAGSGYTLGAIKSDGSVWMWGQGDKGKLGCGGSGTASSPVTTSGGGTTWCTLATSRHNSVAVKTDGTLWVWGYNQQASLGIGTTAASSRTSPVQTCGAGTTWRCAATTGYSMIGLKTDGSLWAWGGNNYGEIGVGLGGGTRSSPVSPCGGGTTWCGVAAAQNMSMGVKTDGTLWTWGRNFCGSLGDGTTNNRSSPGTLAGGGTTWCKVAASKWNGLGLKTDGTLWSWGWNDSGQIGDGTTVNNSSPVSVIGGSTTWVQMGGGYRNTWAIKT